MIRTKIFNVITAGFIMGVGFLLALLDSVTANASGWEDLTFGWVGVVILFIGLAVFFLSWTKLGNR